VVRYLKEMSHKASHGDEKWHFIWLETQCLVEERKPVKKFGQLFLDEITKDVLEKVVSQRRAKKISAARCNRLLALIRGVMRKAMREWEWIDRVPNFRMLPEPKRRIRWITREEADRLIQELPEHLKDMVHFSLATGLRKSNVTDLEWSQVDLERRLAWIHHDQAKAGKPISVPLNAEAMVVLRRQQGKHPVYVFTYQGHAPVRCVNGEGWRNALKRAGIRNFRWHDLRHTWASWHVQAGTPLHVLQELGGWETVEMVRRYAHLAAEHLAPHAERIARLHVVGGSDTNLSQSAQTVTKDGR